MHSMGTLMRKMNDPVFRHTSGLIVIAGGYLPYHSENKSTNPHNVHIVADQGAFTAIKLELFLSLPPKNHALIVKG
jgi:hypothetical protein